MPKRTSPYQMYQYWLQTADADAVRYLKLFTFLEQDRIQELAREVEARPEKREAQRELAARMHRNHSRRSMPWKPSKAVSRILFESSDEIPTGETIAMLAGEMPVTRIPARKSNPVSRWSIFWCARVWRKARARRGS